MAIFDFWSFLYGKEKVKLHCKKCGKDFEMNYWKWLFHSPIHRWRKRLTKCPHCQERTYMKPNKKS